MDLLAYTFQTHHGILGLVVLVLDIIAIVGLLRGSATVMHKLIWIVMIVLLPFLGVVAYYVIGRNARDA